MVKFTQIKPMVHTPTRFFAKKADPQLDIANLAGQIAGGDISNRKINTKTLCDLIGSRYYQHNEEIEMSDEKAVKVFDENDSVLG